MLVTQPGVTSDAGTARGLGLSINGTRPTSSNFMLDGVENNNYLITGPLTPIAPEAMQEYRDFDQQFLGGIRPNRRLCLRTRSRDPAATSFMAWLISI